MSQPQGYFIITPLRLDADDNGADTHIYIYGAGNRGWIPRHMATPSEHEVQMQERRQQHEVMKQEQQGVDVHLQKAAGTAIPTTVPKQQVDLGSTCAGLFT
jgi:cytochrome oxidase assembly protein ShyY1